MYTKLKITGLSDTAKATKRLMDALEEVKAALHEFNWIKSIGIETDLDLDQEKQETASGN